MVSQIRFFNFNQKINMKNNALNIGLGLALGAYIYEFINNLLEQQPLSNALTVVDWKRVLFMGIFGAIVSHFSIKNQTKSSLLVRVSGE